ncbi:MAG: Flp pilus assembly complex ATPase component TadA, partial [Gammaproteobacteria bacterium]|nr:Flp pilus assembly complex ATPase component TadA [Gammaproteobacteria bacterium]
MMLRTIASSRENQSKHPLQIIAERNWKDESHPSRLLSLEFLTTWLAERFGLEYYRIDPLKIDVKSVTDVMSYAYAARFNVLPIKVDSESITFATCEPNITEWETELSNIHHKKFIRVISNPEDIHRYLLEFYSLSRSVLGASNENDQNKSNIQNLEQLMEMGRAGKLDANDQHVVNIVDWLLQYAYDQRASDIHLEPRRETSKVRFRIDGVMHEVYQLPTPVLAAVTSRIKILGRMDVAEKRRPQDGRVKTRTADGLEV